MHVREVLLFFLNAGYAFIPSIPESMWPADPDDIIWTELTLSNTQAANKNMHTPVMDASLVANVFVLRKGGSEVQIVASNGSPYGLVLSMTSTIFMNLVTATKMIMLFPYTTLERRVSIDFTFPLGFNFSTTMHHFESDPIRVNPAITALEVVKPNSETNLLPRSFLDPSTLSVDLPYTQLPYGDSLPGSELVVSSISWQMHVSRANLAHIHTTPFQHSTVEHRYTLAPLVYKELQRTQPTLRIGERIVDPAAAGTGHDLDFMTTVDGIMENLTGPRSPYRHVTNVIAANMAVWCDHRSTVPAELAPSAAVASTAFTVLSNLPPAPADKIRIIFRLKPVADLDGRVWTSLYVTLSHERDSNGARKRLLAGLEDLAMSVSLTAFSRNVDLEMEI
ncbi:hypothetical protein VNI00_013090 [Paramarasmius palmivorus]|uniref:Uncharacterized protein n=1 Tax=Paramarasmius palmivorus TaxID=297713 RepID=A0AAW0C2J3_9AGAR